MSLLICPQIESLSYNTQNRFYLVFIRQISHALGPTNIFAGSPQNTWMRAHNVLLQLIMTWRQSGAELPEWYIHTRMLFFGTTVSRVTLALAELAALRIQQ